MKRVTGGVLPIVLVLVAAAGCSSKREPDEFDVQVTCQDIVRKQMRNPTTVEFSDKTQTKLSAEGLVVAENALGGKVTYRYRCTVSSDTVRLEKLTKIS